MSKIKFLHIADLHLDSPFKGLQHFPDALFNRIQESTFTSFSRLVSAAIFEKVDFIIIAGDLFDVEDRSLRAQARFRKEMLRLQENRIAVYIVHGNHDPLSGSWLQLNWPDNVHVFSANKPEIMAFEREGERLVHLYGFSYHEKAVAVNMTKFYVKQEGSLYHIGILHGSVETDGEHDKYAPFTVSDLLEKDFDYWALGHIHKRQILSENPMIVYPGNIQGRHRKETGEKGGYIVTLSEKETSMQFIHSADILWENVIIPISDVENLTQLLDRCYQHIESIRKSDVASLLTIKLQGAAQLHETLLDNAAVEELIDVLNDDEEYKEHFIFVVSIVIDSTLPIDREKLKEESHFLNDLLTCFETYDSYDEAMLPFLNHHHVRKHMLSFTSEEKEEIKKAAENILLFDIYQSFKK